MFDVYWEMKRKSAIADLLTVMSRLRSPTGCPWDREQDHKTLRWHAVEGVYELMDAIEAGDDNAMMEELGDVLLKLVFQAKLGKVGGVFELDKVVLQCAEILVWWQL